MRVSLAKAGLSAAWMFLEKRHRNTRRSREAAPAELVPSQGLRFGLGLGLRLGPVGMGRRPRLKLTTPTIAQSLGAEFTTAQSEITSQEHFFAL